jgi:hypothetical protein
MRIESSTRFAQRAVATAAIPRRLQMAFPHLRQLFLLLVVGQRRTQPWRQTLDVYTNALNQHVLARLSDELDDLFSMTDSDATFEVLCLVLGLDLAVADGEFPTLYQLVATIEERVSAERLARRAA